MSEFVQDDGLPQLSISMPVDEFERALQSIQRDIDPDTARALLIDCLADTLEPAEDRNDVTYKQGLLYEDLGHVEKASGNYGAALDNYRQAEATMAEVEEYFTLSPITAQASILIHEMQDPVSSVESYEKARELHEAAARERIPPDDTFKTYLTVLTHLAGAYHAAGKTDLLRELNLDLMAYGAITPGIFGFDPCKDEPGQTGKSILFGVKVTSLYEQIFEGLFEPPEGASPKERLHATQEVEKLIDRPDFMPEIPEERELLMMKVFFNYGELLPNPWEGSKYLAKALAIAKKYDLSMFITNAYLSIANNQAKCNRPFGDMIKTTRKAFASAETNLDQGMSVERSGIRESANLLILQLQATGDSVSIDKIQRRLAARGLEAATNAPGAEKPWLN